MLEDPARHLADEARERVRRKRCAGVGVVDAPIYQTGERRFRMRLHIPREIRLVQPIDRDQQHMARASDDDLRHETGHVTRRRDSSRDF